jgi:peptidoglycan hydrolase-like protein with peptidoglycan-binding domain
MLVIAADVEWSAMRRVALVVCAALLVAACGSDEGDSGGSTTTLDPVAAAQRRVSAAEDELGEAQAAFDDASTAFCDDSQSYIESVDRYGSLFGDAAVTVGDVTTAGADLERPREAVQSSSGDVLDAHERLVTAEADLADARAALAEAESGTTTVPEEPETTTTTEPLVPEATVDRVKQAEDDLAGAFAGVTPETPLTEATEQVNAAAFALQVAWLRLFADAGCLTDEQQAAAVDAVASYTTALQTDLKTAGHLDGDVDGIYGPETVAAVEALQTASNLPVTGFVDRATAVALDQAVQAAGGEAASQAVAHTAALQTALTLAGYWTGPIDGQWSDALTAALGSLQSDLGVPVTGVVDAATLEAMQRAIEEARTPPTTEPPATTAPPDDGPGEGPPATAVE